MTDFGRLVKHKLVDLGRSQVWLVGEVRNKTGLYFDKAYLSRIIGGQYENQKIIAAIKEILNI